MVCSDGHRRQVRPVSGSVVADVAFARGLAEASVCSGVGCSISSSSAVGAVRNVLQRRS